MCTYKFINIIITSRAVAVDNMKQILFSDWLFEGQDESILSALIPRKKTLTKFVIIGQRWCYKRKKTAQDSQNKDNIDYSRGFIVPKSQLAFSPGSRNVQVAFDSKWSEIFSRYKKSYINQACWFKWLDLSLVLFFHLNVKKRTRPTSAIYSTLKLY